MNHPPNSSSFNQSNLRTFPCGPNTNVQRNPNNNQDFPLKIVVNAKYVGAIIGHGGCAIREISKSSKARCMVDVNNPTYDENGHLEKVIWISGALDNCTNACHRIMEIIQGELEKDKAVGTHTELKLRVPNQLVGRLIGKGGSSVKKIMEESGASISISDSRNGPLDIYSLYQTGGIDPSVMERSITIRANSIDAVSSAENKISQKLRNYYETDIKAGLIVPPNAAAFGNLMKVPSFLLGAPSRDGPMAGNNYNANAVAAGGTGPPPPSLFFPPAPMNLQLNPFAAAAAAQNLVHTNVAPIPLKSHIYVPNTVVGALIGTKGSHIRNMMFLTGAIIHIEGGPDTGKKQQQKTITSTSTVGATAAASLSATSAEQSKQADNTEANESSAALEEATVAEEKKNEEEASSDVVNGSVTPPTKIVDGDTKAAEKTEEDNNNNAPSEANATALQQQTFKNAFASSNKLNNSAACGPLSENCSDRCVAITGLDFQVYKAQFWVFQRIAESTHQFIDELILTTETFVPSKIIGRIIGRSGQNVRELQRITQAQVKVPEDMGNTSNNGVNQVASTTDGNPSSNNSLTEVPVRITGNYFSLQAVQARFSTLIAESEQKDNQESRRSRSYKGGGNNFNASSASHHHLNAATASSASGGSAVATSSPIPSNNEKSSTKTDVEQPNEGVEETSANGNTPAAKQEPPRTESGADAEAVTAPPAAVAVTGGSSV